MQETVISAGPDLRSYLDVLWRRKRLVLAVVAGTVALAVGLSLMQSPRYRATTEILVDSSTPQQIFDPVTGNAVDPDRDIQNEIEFLASDTVTSAVGRELAEPAPVSVSSRTDADIIQITATSGDPELAAQTANTYAEVYLRERRQQSVADYQESATVVQARLQELNNQVAAVNTQLDAVTLELADPASGTSAEELEQRQARLEQRLASVEQQRTALQGTASQLELTAELLREGSASVTQAASVPSAPYTPQVLRNVALALMVGLILGVGLAFLREYLDDSVRTKEDVELASGQPVLALLPFVPEAEAADQPYLVTAEDPQSPPAEAYRSLRTTIRFIGVDRPVNVIVVTSSRAGEGKSTITANMAVTLARAGQRTLVIDGDLRKPRLHRFFGLDNRAGFTTALVDGPLDEALHEVPEFGRLAIMPSGVVPTDPAELLASGRTDALFERLAPHFDVILVDSPPVLPVSDALVLSRIATAVVLVTSSHKTSKRDVHRSIELLGQVDAPVIGAVLNDVSPEMAYGYGSYGYGEDDPAPQRVADSGRKERKGRRLVADVS